MIWTIKLNFLFHNPRMNLDGWLLHGAINHVPSRLTLGIPIAYN